MTRILVVDDDDLVRLMVRAGLERNGFGPPRRLSSPWGARHRPPRGVDPVKEVFESAGRDSTIEAFPTGSTGKWGCAIYPRGQARGVALFEPDPEYVHGRLVPFDADHEAVAGGKAYILAEFLSLRG